MPESAFRPPSPPTLTSAGCRDRPAIYSGPAAMPTPDGVGGFEAAAIAGLTGIGISSSAVVISRLATYWLPVLPGWLAWRLLRRLGYV